MLNRKNSMIQFLYFVMGLGKFKAPKKLDPISKCHKRGHHNWRAGKSTRKGITLVCSSCGKMMLLKD